MIRHRHVRGLRQRAVLAPLLVLTLTASGCGSGTGTATPAGRGGTAASTSAGTPDTPAPHDAPVPAADDAEQAAAGKADATKPATADPHAAAAPPDKQPPPSRAPAESEPGAPAEGAAETGPRPIEPGTYRYATDGTIQIGQAPSRDMPQTTTLSAAPAQSSRQRQVRDLRDSDGAGTVTEQILQFDADGARLPFMKISSTFAGVSSTYTFTPADAPLVLKRGLRQGDRTQFVLEGNGVTIRTAVLVSGTEQLVVDGTRVQAAVVVIDSTLSGRLSGKQRSEIRIDTKRGLTVKEDVDSDVTSGSVRVRSTYRAALTSLSAT